MECERYKKMISPYIDGELSSEELEVFMKHLEGCPLCQSLIEEELSIHDMVSSAQKFTAPLGFTAKVMNEINEEKQKKNRFWDFAYLFPRLAAICVGIAMMILGIIAGSQLINGNQPVSKQAVVDKTFYLDAFKSTPPESVGGIYLSMMGENNEG